MKLLSRWFGSPEPPRGADFPGVRSSNTPLGANTPFGANAPAGADAADPASAAAPRPPEPSATALIQDLPDDPELLAQCVLQGATARLRQLAAEAIQDPEQLRQLIRQVRGKDNTVYKILKHKRDTLNAAQRAAVQIASEIDALCASLERHAQRNFDAFYVAHYTHFKARWRELAAQSAPEMSQRVLCAIESCREVIAQHDRQTALQAAEDERREAQRLAQQAAGEAAAEAARHQQEVQALEASELTAARELEEKLRTERRTAEALAVRRIGGLIGKAGAVLRAGNTRQAAGLRRAIEERVAAAPAVPLHLARQLQQLDDKLNDFKQWKDYAAAPKRVELIAEMEALIGCTEEPKILADRIKALQDDWRTIGKGIDGDSEADWQRFRNAAQTAYQPCREYFQTQAQLREDNLQKRRSVLDRLKAFEAAQEGESPDWRLLATVVREAPREWRRYSPVERAAVLEIQDTFDAAIGRLRTRLDAWYERNLGERNSLIEAARGLLAQQDSREAIEAVKRLQLRWTASDPVPRDHDQRLWNEFRELCDAVHQKRQQAYAEYCAGLEANKASAVALCESAEHAASLSGPALSEAAGGMRDWRAAFDALGEMPRTEARGLQARFERALDRCEGQLAQERLREAEHSFVDLLEAKARVQDYAWAIAQGAAEPQREILKQAAQSFIETVRRWPKGGLAAIKDALMKADCASAADVAAREAALRTLCVRNEIQNERPTPPEDEVLRREYQVQRLMRGMGQGNRLDADPDTLVFEWLTIGAVPAELHQQLLRRFMASRRTPRARVV